MVCEAELNKTLAEVATAQAKWKVCDAKSRAAVLHALANGIETANLTECAIIMSREMGKPYPEAIGELANCAPIFRYYAEMARDEAGKVAGTTQWDRCNLPNTNRWACLFTLCRTIFLCS